MYLEHFGLRDFPFRLTPDAEFLFMSSGHARAKAYMDYSIWNREGFVVITGDIGCGKTTLLKQLLSELDDKNVQVAKIFQTQLDEVEFLQAVLVEFGFNPFNAKKVELIDMLNTYLIENFHEMRQLVLIVDDAHNLSMRVLEEIRMLSGVETQKEKILHVILVGQPQLNEKLDAPEMEQLLQRVRLRFHLRPLSAEDTMSYIIHRMNIAGADGMEVFKPEVMPVIYKYTGGVPRLINTLCDTALTVAFADSLRTITIQVLKEAIDELQWQPYERRASSRKTKIAARSQRTGQTVAEQEQALARINDKIAPLNGMGQALSLIAERMGNIENIITRMMVLLERRSEKDVSPVSSRKTGGK